MIIYELSFNLIICDYDLVKMIDTGGSKIVVFEPDETSDVVG
jgi:hypothetical protein